MPRGPHASAASGPLSLSCEIGAGSWASQSRTVSLALAPAASMDEQAVLLVIGARMPVSERGARRLELAALVAGAARSLPGELPARR
jgi:hypothetical protein